MRNKQRGSAMLLCLLLAIAATSAVLTITSLAANTAKEQTKREYLLKVRYSIEGVLAKVEQSFGDGSISLGTPKVITCGGISWTATTVDNSVAKPKSYKVTIVGTVQGVSYSRQYVIGNPYALSTFKFAIARNANLSLSTILTTGPASKGDVFVDGTVLLGLFGTVDGNYYTTALVAPIGLTVTGNKYTNQKPLNFPALDQAAYQAAANRTLVGGPGTVTNFTFLQPNELVYVDGDLKLQGVITGTGTIFVKGDLTYVGNSAYADGTALAAFLVTHDVSLGGGGNSVGHIYAEHDVTVTNTTAHNGSIVGIHNFVPSSRIDLTFDQRIKNDQKLGYNLKLPGYWP